jgi:hypothetical protein
VIAAEFCGDSRDFKDGLLLNTVILNPVSERRAVISARVGLKDLMFLLSLKQKVPRVYSHNEENLCSFTTLGMTTVVVGLVQGLNADG